MDTNNLRVMIIKKVEDGYLGQLAKREIYWQNQLRCFIENGGKAQCKRKTKMIQLLVQMKNISFRLKKN